MIVTLGKFELGNIEEKEYSLNFHQTYNIEDVAKRMEKQLN